MGATAAQINKHIWGHVGSLTCLVACQVPSWASKPAYCPGYSPGANTQSRCGLVALAVDTALGTEGGKPLMVPPPIGRGAEEQHLQSTPVQRWLLGSSYLLFLKNTD